MESLTPAQQYNRRLLSRAARKWWRRATMLRLVADAKKYFDANLKAEIARQPKYADELPLPAPVEEPTHGDEATA